MNRILLLLIGFFISSITWAQQNKEVPEMADIMRSNGKIYTVVAVCLTILIGLFVYVFSIDKKIQRLEKK
jgi:hypothetical protein